MEKSTTVTTRHSIALICTGILSGGVVAVLLRVSQSLSLRSPALAQVEGVFGVGQLWWITSAGLLLLIAALAAAYDTDDTSPISVGVAAALLLFGPALVFTSDVLAAWVNLSAALGGFYLASIRFRVTLRLRDKSRLLLWSFLVVVFAAAVVVVIWAILFLE